MVTTKDIHEKKHAEHERRFGDIEKNVGILQSDVTSLRRGQIALQDSQNAGFGRIEAIVAAKSAEEPRISFSMLFTILGLIVTMGVVGVGAFWAVVLLLANPMAKEIGEHKDYTENHGSQLSLLFERTANNNQYSIERNAQQRQEIEILRTRVDALTAAEVQKAWQHGKLEAYEEARRLQEERIERRMESKDTK